ncbi:hypothetical protein WJX81_006786 [Elliptochloris bilobata]|uniref:Uncharacterized protein n=1 Tax=Elliptochloris bilobata TaxID=381761 RepID=A0AAW1QW59_9CHLO
MHTSWLRHVPTTTLCLQVMAWYWPPILTVALLSTLVCLYHAYLVPRGAPSAVLGDYTSAFTLTSFALALLMVFRTNSSYDRWWEARRLWGGLLGTTTDIVRQGLTWGAEKDERLKLVVARWTIAMVFALQAHLRSEYDLQAALQDTLEPDELAWLSQRQHKPQAVSQVLTEALWRMGMPDYQKATVDLQVTAYNAVVASCERLLKQPIPIAYTRHTSRFLVVWICTLPIALFRPFQYATPLVCAVIAFLLIGVENIGVQIEQPFCVLPLEAFCQAIKANVQTQVREMTAANLVVGRAARSERLTIFKAALDERDWEVGARFGLNGVASKLPGELEAGKGAGSHSMPSRQPGELKTLPSQQDSEKSGEDSEKSGV